MPKFPVLAAVVLFAGFACLSQQPTTTTNNAADPTKTAEQEQAEKDFRENRTAFLNETLLDVQNLRSRENRIFFSSEIASAMWEEDETRARSLFAGAAGEVIAVVRQTDQAVIAATARVEQRPRYSFLGDPPDSAVLRRKLSAAMGVRRALTSSIMELDPDLAFSFFLDSRDVISDPDFKESLRAQDSYYEGQLLAGLVLTNANKAVELGKRSLKDGVTFSHTQLLRNIYAKDAAKGVEFGSAILSALKSNEVQTYVLFDLLELGSQTADEAKKTGKQPIYTDSELRDIA